MKTFLEEKEYYGQNPCIPPDLLLRLLSRVAKRIDYPARPRVLKSEHLAVSHALAFLRSEPSTRRTLLMTLNPEAWPCLTK